MPCSDCSPAFTALTKLKECKLLSTIRSNHAPFASQRTELSELVTHAEKELVKYRETVARLQEMIIALENEKENLKRQTRLGKSLMAPIRKLPPEILGKIFIDHGVTNLLDSLRSKADIPGFKLASVCSHWRSIAIGTPGLWNNFRFNLRGTKQASYVTLIENLLRLSAKSKLNITIHASVDAAVPACLPLLCDQANRWHSMAGCLLGLNEPLLEVLSSLQRRLTSLQMCNLAAPFIHYSAWIEGAPKLHTATVFDIDPSSTAIPWNQIVDLTLFQSYPPDIAASLSNLPNLRILQVDCPRVHSNDPNYAPEHQPHSKLSSLKFLISKDEDEVNMAKLLEMLVLPKLESLSIVAKKSFRTNQGDICWSFKEIPSLIWRSSAPISSFHLDNVWVPTDDLIALLRSMPALSTLFLSEPSYSEDSNIYPMINDQLLSTIHCHQHCRPILTHLTSLTLKGSQPAFDSVFSMHLFVKVVHSRWKPPVLEDEVACIQTVKLEAANISIPRNAVQTLMMLRTRGLLISLRDKDGEVSLWEED